MHLVSDTRKRPGLRRKSFLGQMVLVFAGLQIAFFGSFTCFDLPTGTGSNLYNYAHGQLRYLALMTPRDIESKIRQYAPAVLEEPPLPRRSTYVPLAPAAVFIGYAFGPRLALISIALFLVLGILGPLFGIFPLASGGGPGYFLEPGFGYLLGTASAALLCGWITQNKRTSLSQIAGLSAGLLALHLTGVVYLLGTYLYFYMFEGSKTYLEWQPWIFQYLRNLSWYALPYDFIFSIVAIGLAFPFRWLARTLTSPPDTNQPSKKVKYDRKSLDELVRS